ncbi:Rho-GAP domain-containing protein, partial [Trichostrongylus colubriformis]
RAASFAHARAGVSRLLDDGCRTLTGKAILLVAVAELQDYFSDEETNLLLTEGSELATSIGASFITIPPDASSQQTAELARFFERVRNMVPKTSTLERPMKKNRRGFNDSYVSPAECARDKYRKSSHNMYGGYRTSQSAATLLSESSASGDSTLSSGPVERVTSAASAPALRNSISAMSISHRQATCHQRTAVLTVLNETFFSSSASSRPRRRVAPMTSPLRLPIAHETSSVPAPLATPEMIDIAPEYSVVQRPLRSRMFSNHSSTEPSSSPSQPSSAGSSMHRNEVNEPNRLTVKSPTVEWRWLPKSPCEQRRSAKTAPLKPQIAPKPTNVVNPKMVCSMPTRSVTMDVINRESVVKARQIYAQGPQQKTPALRQSLSIESFADLMGEKKKKFYFVRKVATSFRFKKPEKEPVADKLVSAPYKMSRSLPQSPHVERKPRKPACLASSEKTSNAFSWLPSRSPKRAHRTITEIIQGVVSPTDTLETLAAKNDGIPLFLTRCVEFIEKMMLDVSEEGGLELEGLYRVPGNQAQLSELEKAFREKGDVDIASLDMPVHVVATAVKNFFSCLAEPLIPTELHQDILDCINGSEVVEQLHAVMSRLTPVNRNVLIYFTSHLGRVASSPSTAMDVHNLSKVLFPTLFRPQFNDFLEMSSGTAKFQQATEVILQNAHEIFHSHQAQSLRV